MTAEFRDDVVFEQASARPVRFLRRYSHCRPRRAFRGEGGVPQRDGRLGGSVRRVFLMVIRSRAYMRTNDNEHIAYPGLLLPARGRGRFRGPESVKAKTSDDRRSQPARDTLT